MNITRNLALIGPIWPADFNGDGITDVNRDGLPDLIVATSSGGDGDNYFDQGDAEVLLNIGDGRFAPWVGYPTLPGAWQIVVADLNRDGILDVATANKSAKFRDDCGPSFRMFRIDRGLWTGDWIAQSRAP